MVCGVIVIKHLCKLAGYANISRVSPKNAVASCGRIVIVETLSTVMCAF